MKKHQNNRTSVTHLFPSVAHFGSSPFCFRDILVLIFCFPHPPHPARELARGGRRPTDPRRSPPFPLFLLEKLIRRETETKLSSNGKPIRPTVIISALVTLTVFVFANESHRTSARHPGRRVPQEARRSSWRELRPCGPSFSICLHQRKQQHA